MSAARYFRSKTAHVTDTALVCIDASDFRGFAEYLRANPGKIAIPRAEYLAKTKKEREPHKNNAASYFVPCESKNGVRSNETAGPCNLICVDVDDTGQALRLRASMADADLVGSPLLPWDHLIYETAGSTPDAPRFRVVVSADGIPPIDYVNAVSTVARKLGQTQVNGESYVVSQAMFYPVRFTGETRDPLTVCAVSGQSFTLRDVDGEPPLPSFGNKRVDTRSVDAINHLVAPDPGFSLQDWDDALAHVDLSGVEGNRWLDIARAGKHQFPDHLEEAFVILDRHSERFPDAYDPQSNRKKWDYIRSQPFDRDPVTIATLIQLAKDGGWKRGLKGFNRALDWLKDPARTRDELAEAPEKIAAIPELSSAQKGEALAALLAAYRRLGITLRAADLKDDMARALQKKQTSKTPKAARSLVYVGGVTDELHNPLNGYHTKPACFDREHQLIVPAGVKLSPTNYAIRCGIPCVGGLGYMPGAPVFYDGHAAVKGEDGKPAAQAVKFLNLYRETFAPANSKSGPEARRLLERHINALVLEPDLQRMLWDFLAFIVQNPGRKVRWAVLIQGAQGCGKGTLGDVMVAALGDTNVRVIESGHVVSEFNEWMFGRMLNIISEVHNIGDRKHTLYGKLKTPVSDSTLPALNIKNRTLMDGLPNVTSYLAFTNHADAFPAEETDRRWAVVFSPLQTKEAVLRVLPEMQELHRFRLDPVNAGAFRWALENHPVSASFDPDGHAPQTTYKEVMARASETPLKAAVRNAIESSESPLVRKDLLSVNALKMHVAEEEPTAREQYISSCLLELGYVLCGRVRLTEGGRHRVYAKRGEAWDGAHISAIKSELGTRVAQSTDVTGILL